MTDKTSKTKEKPEKQAKKPLSGTGCRRKGHNFERSMVHRFREVFGDTVKRGVDQAQNGGAEPDVAAAGPFWVECKRGKVTAPRPALRQAQEAMARQGLSAPYLYPVAVCKDDTKPATVTLLLDDFIAILGEWWPSAQSAYTPDAIRARKGAPK